MNYEVEFTRSAMADLSDIVEWIARNDSSKHAIHVLDQIQTKTDSLSAHPDRGAVPPELRPLGIDKYREVFFKPYRITYHVRDNCVIINLVADGRRDMASLLQRRLTMPHID